MKSEYLIISSVFIAALVAFSITGNALRIWETKSYCYSINSPYVPVNQETWVRELYGMCALKDPNGGIVLKIGPTSEKINPACLCVSSSISNSDFISDCWYTSTHYVCSLTKKLDKPGTWKLGIAIGYVNKTWNGTDWIIEEGIAANQTYEIVVSEIPMPPETSSEILQRLWNKFINLF
jgi:hypothetical protein